MGPSLGTWLRLTFEHTLCRHKAHHIITRAQLRADRRPLGEWSRRLGTPESPFLSRNPLRTWERPGCRVLGSCDFAFTVHLGTLEICPSAFSAWGAGDARREAKRS